jgi:phosphomannomutase/phosphoglucomutase
VWVRLLPLALATVLVVVAIFCAWQTWLVAREGHARATVHQAQQQAFTAIRATVRAQRARIDQALGDAPLLAELGRQTGAGRRAAAARAMRLLPNMHRVEFFSASLEEVVHADYPHFGYAKAAG